VQVTKIAGQVVESLLSIAGIRVDTEEPHFIRRPLTNGVEIRQYGPRIAAETTVAGDEECARSIGFRRLARYIFGGNHRDVGVGMTAPLAQRSICGDKIAMTAPVAQSLMANGRWAIRFYMPSKWSLETLPTPDDDSVALATVPGETLAVLRFSGDRSAKAIANQTDELLKRLHDNGIEPAGVAVAWFYDPPWTLPFRRRSEVAVPISQI
jgi:SOUL heme-binding protein